MANLFWVDLEMTGLDVQKDSILEIAIIITDIEFNPLEEYHTVVFQSQKVLDNMNDWCKKHHAKSGLTKLVQDGRKQPDVEEDILRLVKKHFKPKERIIVCGNSVSLDRDFLERNFKKLAERLHYRIIDVSSFKEIFGRKFGYKIDKKGNHRALNDIKESINELKTYLSYVKFPKKKES